MRLFYSSALIYFFAATYHCNQTAIAFAAIAVPVTAAHIPVAVTAANITVTFTVAPGKPNSMNAINSKCRQKRWLLHKKQVWAWGDNKTLKKNCFCNKREIASVNAINAIFYGKSGKSKNLAINWTISYRKWITIYWIQAFCSTITYYLELTSTCADLFQ